MQQSPKRESIQHWLFLKSLRNSINFQKQEIIQKRYAPHLYLYPFGEVAFGTSAGDCEMGYTLRASENEDIEHLIKWSKDIISEIAHEHQLKYQIEFTEVFPTTSNTSSSYYRIKQATEKLRFSILELNEPMKWSEDFGYYHPQIETGFFGLGSGIHHAELHHPDFDFPDELALRGVDLFFEIFQTFQ